MGDLAVNLVASALFGGALWLAGVLGRYRRRARVRRFFGLGTGQRATVVVGRDTWGRERSVSRGDVAAMVELAVIVKSCDAEPDFHMYQSARGGLGEQTEFCVGGPSSNDRTAAHLRQFLPGVGEGEDGNGDPELRVGAQRYPYRQGESVVVLVARLYRGADQARKPLFLILGQTAAANHAGARFLARESRRLAATYPPGREFCLVLRIIDPRSYGNNLVEFLGDVSEAAFA
ncbi:hypothetical protein LWF15_23605 [Kineosporia rhizophila]|uniref:hypothetical protein n=1 Tax=Kineosporia TaxID=49184 RepID=UPI001E59E6F3|nr:MULTISPECIES: hypothetical protein [Kineosporia]MCE0538490.1 hypothetical protein [Kineosporia rhizophila]